MAHTVDRVNLGTSLVATAPSPATSGTSIIVTTGEGANFPRTPFLAIAHPEGTLPTRSSGEIILVNTVSTDTFTVVRAQDGTSAKSIAIGWRISAALAASHVSENGGLYENTLINGAFDIWQRNTTFTTPNNDTYLADRWNCLQEANAAWTFTRSTDVPDGFTYSMKAANVTADKQCGYIQIVENLNAVKFKNQYVSLSFWAKTTTGKIISNLRATVLSWSSTADVVTSDVMGTWAQNGTDPTFATNWTKEVAGSNLALVADTWTEYKVENIFVDTASMANIAVVIWVDDGSITAADEFYVTGVQLNQGRFAMPFEPRIYSEEFSRCQRYYQQYITPKMAGVVSGTAPSRFGMPIPRMRVPPTCVFGALNIWDGGTATTLTGVGTSYHTIDTLEIDGSSAAPMTAGRACVAYQGASSATVTADAEL